MSKGKGKDQGGDDGRDQGQDQGDDEIPMSPAEHAAERQQPEEGGVIITPPEGETSHEYEDGEAGDNADG